MACGFWAGPVNVVPLMMLKVQKPLAHISWYVPCFPYLNVLVGSGALGSALGVICIVGVRGEAGAG